MFSYVLLSHLIQFLLTGNVSLQSCTDYHTPSPSQTLATTPLAGTTLLKTYHCHSSSLYKLLLGQTAFFFGFFSLEGYTP